MKIILSGALVGAWVGVLVLAVAFLACQPASTAAAACANIARVGCPLGVDPMCPAALERAVSANHAPASAIACAQVAASKAALAACSPYFACP